MELKISQTKYIRFKNWIEEFEKVCVCEREIERDREREREREGGGRSVGTSLKAECYIV